MASQLGAPRLELFYQPVREGAHSDCVSTCDSVKRKLNALEFGLTFFVIYFRARGFSFLTLKFISCLRAKDVAEPSCDRVNPVLLQACWKEQLDADGFYSCHELSEAAAVSPE